MPGKFFIQETNIRRPDGQETSYFDIYALIMVEGHEMPHTSSEIGFSTREEAEAWVEKHSV
ncbi:hypothetical protein [Neotabrizicola sp. sgz301269]|uniref:hypothetical protein n=1 Tax=Neotabrizicola sp. sgz301269 TaxID=3276282 RepID=UPI00376F839B